MPLNPRSGWELRITTEAGAVRSWDWVAFRALPAEDITVEGPLSSTA